MIDPNELQNNDETPTDNVPEKAAVLQEELIEDFEEEDSADFNDEDGYEDYGSSGEKYGWYNGFSDDVIDDAFEGDPEATWNVD